MRSALCQHGARHDHGEAAEAGQHLQDGVLERELAEEGQAQRDVALRELVELGAAGVFLLEGDDLAQALHRIDGEGAELARRFARLAAQAIDALAHQEGAQAHGEQERQQRQRQPAVGPGQHRDHGRRHQDGDEGRRHGVGEEVLDQLDVVGGQRHQIAGAPAHQIGRRQRIELAEGVDAHLGQQAEGHVVRQPGFEPVQDARQAAPRRRARWRSPRKADGS